MAKWIVIYRRETEFNVKWRLKVIQGLHVAI